MPPMPKRPTRRLSLVLGLATILAACAAAPTPAPQSPTASASATRTPSPTATPSPTPSPTPEPPLSLPLPDERDDRRIRFSTDIRVPAEGDGQIVVGVTSLTDSRIDQVVLRWPTDLRDQLFLSPVDPRPLGPQDLFVVTWTKWVDGPGEHGEPARTTSLGLGPLAAGATVRITIHVTRRAAGPVEFDLQFLAGEAILAAEDGEPAELRVAVE